MGISDDAKSNWEAATDLIDEELLELNEVIAISTTRNIEEISELYKSSHTNKGDSTSKENEHKVRNAAGSNVLLSLTTEIFSNRDELMDTIRKATVMEGYVTVIRKSKTNCYVILGCDRGGKYHGASTPLNERKKASASCLIGCPFEIRGKKKDGCWKVERKCAFHNHEPSSDMSGHSYCRRFQKKRC